MQYPWSMVLHGTFTECSSGAVRNWSGTPKSGVFFPVGTFTEHSLRAVSVNVRTEKILRILEFRCSNYCTGTALLAVIVHVTTGADTASSGCPLSSPRTQTKTSALRAQIPVWWVVAYTEGPGSARFPEGNFLRTSPGRLASSRGKAQIRASPEEIFSRGRRGGRASRQYEHICKENQPSGREFLFTFPAARNYVDSRHINAHKNIKTAVFRPPRI